MSTSLLADLRHSVDGEIRFDLGSRAAYATDASNYRQVPIGVVVPRTVEDGVAAVAVCREHDAPVLSRGGGTSLAGQCCNAAVVIDWSKYCARVVELDPRGLAVVVEPGIVLDALNAQTRRNGLIFGPRPATHDHCTLGGMIGNNSCGATAQAYGKTSDNVLALEVLTYDGDRFWVGETTDEQYRRILAEGGRRAEVYRRAVELRDRYARLIRERFPRIPRRVSGYNLDALLPENGFNLARALVGSESTLVTVLHARLRLVREPKARSMVVLGYRDIFTAADAAPEIAEHRPLVLEGLDDKLIGFERRKHLGGGELAFLPEGAGWLMVQFGGETADEAASRAQDLVHKLHRGANAPTAAVFTVPGDEDRLWHVRDSALGATARVAGMPDTWPGWEDSAVAPERLGGYLRELHTLMEEFGYQQAALYGHFGHGCVHTRLPFDLTSAAGLARTRAFVERAADLVVSHGGSLSGEHGDGQSRAGLWPKMFGEQLMPAFAEFKDIFDPGDRMNPGKLIHPGGAAPYRMDENLRLGVDYDPPDPATRFGYPHDSGSFSRAALRCVGVGLCRRDEGGVMCPSYRVTREEEHSTRGRARLLFEMLQGGPIGGGWRSPEVREALDLCLACKGCKSDCPVNVDMATYKAEFLHHHYKRRVRPAAHYSMGWLPLAARIMGLVPGPVNAVTALPGLSDVLKRLGGVAAERPLPAFAPITFRSAYARRGPRGTGHRGEVVLWPDTFADLFHPEVAAAAVEVLEDAGFRVRLPRRVLCCGLTWISTGQLGIAERMIRRTVRGLRAEIRAGLPVVGLEPSCTAVFRSDAPELLPHDQDVRRLRDQTFTLAELLERYAPDWAPPPVHRPVLAQLHCHQHAIMGYAAETRLLHRAGADLRVLDAGCCGLAGDFGFERGHFAVSMACAEHGLLPAVRDADPRAFIVADGFSCRIQIEHAGTGRQAVHLAEALLSNRRSVPDHFPERVARRLAAPRAARHVPADELRKAAAAAGVPRGAAADAACIAGETVPSQRRRPPTVPAEPAEERGARTP